MGKKKSPKRAVKNIEKLLDESFTLPKTMINLASDHIWNDLVEAGYIKARYAFYVGVGKIRNHFVD